MTWLYVNLDASETYCTCIAATQQNKTTVSEVTHESHFYKCSDSSWFY